MNVVVGPSLPQGQPGSWVRSLPNLLTAVRVVVTPVIIGLLLWEAAGSNQAAAVLFIVAGTSDVLDGFFARRYQSGSQLGIFFDLVGDKLLVSAVLIVAVDLQWLPAWLAFGFIGRELFVMGMRSYASSQRVTVAAGHLWKKKMMWQYIALNALMWDRVPLTWTLVICAFILTSASGVHYVVNISRVLHNRPAPDVPEPI